MTNVLNKLCTFDRSTYGALFEPGAIEYAASHIVNADLDADRMVMSWAGAGSDIRGVSSLLYTSVASGPPRAPSRTGPFGSCTWILPGPPTRIRIEDPGF
jgi:hypothetical protein